MALKRLPVFLVATFGISWSAWWTLVEITPAKGLTFDNPLLLTLYLLGGFGPTIAAFVAVLATPAEGSFGEYAGRLFRWRVSPLWWGVAFVLPAALAFGPQALAQTIEPGRHAPLDLQPMARLVPLFATMIIGGGLEELGWRGVAQPALQQRIKPLLATPVIGAVWVCWHLPLFHIKGTAQFHMDLAPFALETMATAFFLAWLYGQSRSILLCVFFHAATNTAASMDLSPADHSSGALIVAALKLALGVAVLIAAQPRVARAN